MKKVAGTLKLVYSQYRELQSFAQFGSDLDLDTKMRLAQGERIVEVLKQKNGAPVPVEKQVAILYAVINNVLERVQPQDVAEYEQGLFTWLDSDPDGINAMGAIKDTGELTDSTVEALKATLETYTKQFLNSRNS